MPNGKSPKELGYETEDLQWPVVLWSLGFILVFMIVTIFGLAWVFSARDSLPAMRSVAPVATAEKRPIPSGPLLQAQPPLDLHTYEAEAFSHMENFGWVDEATGKVHVPIKKAMEIALEQGFATGIPAPPADDEPSAEEAPSEEPAEDAL